MAKLTASASLVRAALSLVFAAFALPALSQTVIAHNTPRFVTSTRSMGAVEPASPMEVSIWLKPHNKSGLDAAARELYNKDSARYRHWLTREQFSANYAPTAAELSTVRSFATANHLTVTSVGPQNFYVRVAGTAAQIESAFHVTLNRYNVNGSIVRANAEDPQIAGEAGALVNAVSGLDSLSYAHPLIAKRTGPPVKTSPGATVGEASSVNADTLPTSSFNADCFTGTTTQTFTNSGALPDATYTGNLYTKSASGCAYTPQNIRAAYGLNKLYADKYDGTGQTIVIIDWCGSPTILSDANAFSAQFGLPKLTSKNFQIINTPAPSYCAAPDAEINLDVEWAHAIAPGAKIDLVVPPSASFQDIDEAYFYAVNYQLGNVISGSYGAEEAYVSPTTLITEDLISEIAAVTGIGANFSTGDDGDLTYNEPSLNPASIFTPADSGYVTGVGGVSLALNANNTIAWQTGWGNNLNLVSDQGTVTDPPAGNGFFYAGSGGGESGFFLKPYFQETLPGIGRQLPDVSWLADPYTGVYVAISSPDTVPELQYQIVGGTSLSCPMFSALWAIANQIAETPLGQAAPYLYGLPASVITDIVPVSSKTNVTGTVKDSTGKKTYSAAVLGAPLEGTTNFISVLWDYPLYQDTAYVLTFGTDSGLTVAKGWDNVTGVGVPNPGGFSAYFKP